MLLFSMCDKSITIVLRGDSFRKVVHGEPFPESDMKKSDKSCDAESNQIFCLNSIYYFIILPYIERGYSINISGIIYEFEKNALIRSFFLEKGLNIDIREISRNNTNQVTTFISAFERAATAAPDSELFIILRLDQTFMKRIPLESTLINKICYPGNGCCSGAWIPKYGIADHIFVVGNQMVDVFMEALKVCCEKSDINHLHNILTYLESTQISNTLPFWFSATDTTDHFYIDLQRSGHEEQYAERLKELTKMWDL